MTAKDRSKTLLESWLEQCSKLGLGGASQSNSVALGIIIMELCELREDVEEIKRQLTGDKDETDS